MNSGEAGRLFDQISRPCPVKCLPARLRRLVDGPCNGRRAEPIQPGSGNLIKDLCDLCVSSVAGGECWLSPPAEPIDLSS